MSDDPLDRPVWSALAGGQATLGLRHGRAARFRPAIGPLCGTAAGDVDDLAPLAEPGETLILLEAGEPAASPRLTIEGARACVQLVLEHAPDAVPLPEGVRALGPDDAPAMLALATLTEPGPFRAETWRFGGFIGLYEGERLIAMAGERLRPPGYCEISAVCTHPDARGRGIARALTIAKLRAIVARGEVPFLHAYADNAPAIALYQRLGFAIRRELIATRFTESK